MDKSSLTQNRARVKTLANVLSLTGGYVFDGEKFRPASIADYVDETGDFAPGQDHPAFNLAIFSETVENDTEPDFTQNPAAPAERGICEHPGGCLADLPHRSMTLAQRVELMRGPAEEGID